MIRHLIYSVSFCFCCLNLNSVFTEIMSFWDLHVSTIGSHKWIPQHNSNYECYGFPNYQDFWSTRKKFVRNMTSKSDLKKVIRHISKNRIIKTESKLWLYSSCYGYITHLILSYIQYHTYSRTKLFRAISFPDHGFFKPWSGNEAVRKSSSPNFLRKKWGKTKSMKHDWGSWDDMNDICYSWCCDNYGLYHS